MELISINEIGSTNAHETTKIPFPSISPTFVPSRVLMVKFNITTSDWEATKTVVS